MPTQTCLVIGDPISHSLSPIMHTAGYKELGIEAEFMFKASLVKASELAKAVAAMRTLNIRGMSVTLPHKEAIIEHLDQVDPLAQKMGAINTVVNYAGVLVGFNTDCIGVTEPIKKKLDLSKSKVLVLGAGGAARAAIFGLKLEEAEVYIHNRTLSKAEALAAEANAKVRTELDDLELFDVIVNATSVGMQPNVQQSPIPKSSLKPKHLVFDSVYKPHETQLLKDAMASGCQIIYGIEMLLEQGAAQFELYTEQEAPIAAMRAALVNETTK